MDLKSLLEGRPQLYKSVKLAKKRHPYPGMLRREEASETTKLRTINNPVDQLKRLQRLILRRILSQVQLPSYMFGAVSGKTLTSHAAGHIRNQNSTIVKLDVSDYFPSISCLDVYYVWSIVLGCPPSVAQLLTELTTVDWHLPQGAPTSPMIANIFLASIYAPVCVAGENLGLTITTWIDDLIFSGPAAREVMATVRSVLEQHGLKVSKKKCEILGHKDEKIITGVRLGRFSVRAPHRKMSEIRAAIHRLAIGDVPSHELERYKRNLRARIAHIATICRKDAEELKRQGRAAGVNLLSESRRGVGCSTL